MSSTDAPPSEQRPGFMGTPDHTLVVGTSPVKSGIISTQSRLTSDDSMITQAEVFPEIARHEGA